MHRTLRFLGLTLASLALTAVTVSAAAPASPVYRSDVDAWRFEKAVPPIAAPGRDAPAGSRGWSFSPNVFVHPEGETGQHIWPDIALAEEGTLGIAWMDDHAAGGYHIFYVYSTDEGLTWSAPERVDDRTTGSYSKFVTLAFTPFGTAVAVWEDDRTGGIQLYFSKRTGTPGQPWTPSVRINTAGGSPSGSDFMNASLAVLDELRYFVAWTDWREGPYYQVYCRSTLDGGATWGPERRVSDGLGYQPVAGDPCLIVDPNAQDPGAEVLYCVTNDWRGYAPGGRLPNVYFYRSADGGLSWSIGVMVNDLDPGFQQTSSHALVKLDDGSLAAGWLNNPDWGLNHFWACRSLDQGASWVGHVQVDEPGSNGTGTYSSIATDGAYLFAMFDLYTTSWDEYFRASPNGGADWPDASLRVDDDVTGAATGDPVLAAPRWSFIPPQRDLRVYAAWQDTRPPGYNWKVMASRGTLAGQGVPESGAVPALTLRISPNPSHAEEGVRFALSRGVTPIPIGIFDAAGRAVRALRIAPGGTVWDGRDALARPVPAGCYWVRMGTVQGTRLIRLPSR